jgi:hypothetical protein
MNFNHHFTGRPFVVKTFTIYEILSQNISLMNNAHHEADKFLTVNSMFRGKAHGFGEQLERFHGSIAGSSRRGRMRIVP